MIGQESIIDWSNPFAVAPIIVAWEAFITAIGTITSTVVAITDFMLVANVIVRAIEVAIAVEGRRIEEIIADIDQAPIIVRRS